MYKDVFSLIHRHMDWKLSCLECSRFNPQFVIWTHVASSAKASCEEDNRNLLDETFRWNPMFRFHTCIK